MVGYCPDTKCQKQHWKSDGGHKAECAALLEARLHEEKEQAEQSLKKEKRGKKKGKKKGKKGR